MWDKGKKLSKCGEGCVASLILEDEQNREYKVTAFYDLLREILQYATDVDEIEDLADKLSFPSKYFTSFFLLLFLTGETSIQTLHAQLKMKMQSMKTHLPRLPL